MEINVTNFTNTLKIICACFSLAVAGCGDKKASTPPSNSTPDVQVKEAPVKTTKLGTSNAKKFACVTGDYDMALDDIDANLVVVDFDKVPVELFMDLSRVRCFGNNLDLGKSNLAKFLSDHASDFATIVTGHSQNENSTIKVIWISNRDEYNQGSGFKEVVRLSSANNFQMNQ